MWRLLTINLVRFIYARNLAVILGHLVYVYKKREKEGKRNLQQKYRMRLHIVENNYTFRYYGPCFAWKVVRSWI